MNNDNDNYNDEAEEYARLLELEGLQEETELTDRLEVFDEEYDENQESFSIREVVDFGDELPAVAEAFVQKAIEISHGNDVPASISFFTILGQICKDFIHIPYDEGREDTRVHFCWLQTSGTGKSTLWNFVGPVSKRVFEKINAQGTGNLKLKHPALNRTLHGEEEVTIIQRKFDVFGLTDYTDAVLIGGYSKDKPEPTEDDPTPKWIDKRNAGQLEGNGLAHWDEFEYSGIFSQSQHQEKAIVYLNTLMNSLAGESWVISKALMSYDNKIMECFCERSVLAMSYPPINLNEVIATKGVMQRMLLYVKNVSKEAQDDMRLEQIYKAGRIKDNKQPIEKYADSIYKCYTTLQERFNEVNQEPLKTMTYDASFNRALVDAYGHMKTDLLGVRLEVDDLADNFTTRMAESPSIPNKEERFIVTGDNVRQAERIVRQCYKSLVRWLDQSLSRRRESITDIPKLQVFVDSFNSMVEEHIIAGTINEDKSIHKTKLLERVEQDSKIKIAQVYRDWAAIEKLNVFETSKYGRSVYVKLIESDEK